MAVEIAVGVSSLPDVHQAGRQAANHLLSNLGRGRLEAVVAFSSVRFADKRMLAGVQSVLGGVPLVGCTDSGGITVSGPNRRSVTLVGFTTDSARFIPSVARHLRADARAAGQALVRAFPADAWKEAKALLVFPDGLGANASDLIRGIESALDVPIPIIGGSAGDDFFFQKTFQFHGDEVFTDSVSALLLSGDIQVGVGARHGWVPLGRPRRVTRATGHIVYELDRRPAVSIYEDYLGVKREELLHEPLAHVAMTYPLGRPRKGTAEYLVRDALRVGRGGSLVCTGDVVEGSDVRLMIGGYESALEAAQGAAYEALEQLGGRRRGGALIFSSVARQKMLGSEFHGEIDVIRDALGGAGVRLGGFYTYGEMAPVRGGRRGFENVFHNETVVVMAIS
jgi:hypothetical protein